MTAADLQQQIEALLQQAAAPSPPRPGKPLPPQQRRALAHVQAQLQAQQYPQAQAASQALLAQHPHLWPALHLLGWSYLGQGRHEQALPHLVAAASHLDGDALVWQHLAIALNRCGQCAQAGQVYAALLQRQPADAALLNNAAKNAMDSGALAQAQVWCRRACEQSPGMAEAWNNLGNIEKALGHWDAAVQAYQRALQAAPQMPAAHNNLGVLYKNLGQLAQARHHLQQAVALAPGYLQAHCNLANLLHLQGQHAQAIDLLQALLKQAPNLLEAHNTLALCLQASGRAQQALQIWLQLIAARPAWADPYLNAANLLRHHGQAQDALAILQRGQGQVASSPQWHNNWAVVHKELGHTDAALAQFRLAIAELQKRTSNPPPRPKAYMDVKLAHTALLAFKSAMATIGVPFFLVSGTLLGIVRDGDLLPHDKDMDVGLDWGVPREVLLERLCERGFGIPEMGLRATQADRDWQMSVVHRETGIAIDLFFFKPDGQMLWCGFNHRPTPLLLCFQRFALQPITYLGEEWLVPHPPEQFLQEMYGSGWRVPDPYFDSIISGYNRSPQSLQVALCFAYNRLFDRIDRGEWEKAAGYCRQIQAQQFDPFIDELNIWLDARLREEANKHIRH